MIEFLLKVFLLTLLLITYIEVALSLSERIPKSKQDRLQRQHPTQQGETFNHSISSVVLPQTEEDRQLEEWFRKEGILLGSVGGRHVQVATTERSVGGRGVFWTPSSAALCANVPYAGAAHQGDILAHIPGPLVLSPSNLPGSCPALFTDNTCDNERTREDGLSWQSILTTYAWKLLHTNAKGPYQKAPQWKEWIQTWIPNRENMPSSSVLSGPNMPTSFKAYSTDVMERLARLSHSTPLQVQTAIQTRYNTFEHDWDNVKKIVMNGNEDDETRIKQEFGELYSLVLSRTTNLGPEWGNQMGIIPLHDMLNHPPWKHEPNVELFCLGNIRATIGNDQLKMLLCPLLTEKQLRGEAEQPCFSDRDFVIAARKRIDPFEELFLSYKTVRRNMSEQEQIWLLLQYGFPFCP